MNDLKISLLEEEDIDGLRSLQPAGWNDIRNVFRSHFGRPYFEAYKGMSEGELVAVGHNIYCNDSAWLGNIIVSLSQRNMGFGTSMTQFLIDCIYNRGIENIYLLATALGRPIYFNLGFSEMTRFAFIKFDLSQIEMDDSYLIRRVKKADLPFIFDLDKQATGEDRSDVIRYFVENGFLISGISDNIEGFYLPNLGDGLIIANSEGAGIELSKLRFQHGRDYVVVPNGNIHFLEKTGISFRVQSRIAYYMFKGAWKNWHPNMIYSRVGGYLG